MRDINGSYVTKRTPEDDTPIGTSRKRVRSTSFFGTINTPSLVGGSANFTDVIVGTANVSDMDAEIQGLSVLQTQLQTQINDTRVMIRGAVPIRYPLQPLNDANASRAISSSEINNAAVGLSASHMFDNIYGQNAISVYTTPSEGGWITQEDINNDQTSLVVDGVLTYGDFNYLDLLPDTMDGIIMSFQLYAISFGFPIVYQIIGSNDAQEWTSLFKETELTYEATYVHGDSEGMYTSVTPLTKRDTYYRFVGILIEEHVDPTRAWVQELLLFGG